MINKILNMLKLNNRKDKVIINIVHESEILDTVTVDVNTIIEFLPSMSIVKKYNENEAIDMECYQARESCTFTVPFNIYSREYGWHKLSNDEIVDRVKDSVPFAESLDKILKEYPNREYNINTFTGKIHYKYIKNPA